MLKEKINADYMTAMKLRDNSTKNLLSVVKGEVQTIEKNLGIENLSDEEVIKILNKIAKSLRESIQTSPSNSELNAELDVIESYLPKQMTEEEINTKIDEAIINGAKTISDIMKVFNGLPVDRKLVSSIYLNKTK
jgi:uncharacterized protein YqeY